MNKSRRLHVGGTVVIALAGTMAACAGQADDAENLRSDSQLLVGATPPRVGATLPGINGALFTEAKAAFDTVDQITDGLGPIFNERACSNCHSLGADGGAGENTERRFGTFTANG